MSDAYPISADRRSVTHPGLSAGFDSRRAGEFPVVSTNRLRGSGELRRVSESGWGVGVRVLRRGDFRLPSSDFRLPTSDSFDYRSRCAWMIALPSPDRGKRPEEESHDLTQDRHDHPDGGTDRHTVA